MTTMKSYSAGEVIFRQGDAGDSAYLVQDGSVRIELDDGGQAIHLATRQPGELFGEMAIIDDQPRSASAIAAEDCTLLPLTQEQLQYRMQAADPILRMCTLVILGYLRNMLAQIPNDGSRPPPPAISQPDPQIRTEALLALQLEHAIAEGIRRDEFILHFQPITELATGWIVGFEALVRWQTADRGMVSPAHFIPAAERSGQITAITDQALQQGCLAIRHLQEALDASAPIARPPLFMSINFSGLDLADAGLLDRIEAALQAAGARPEQLKLEVTETLLMQNPKLARDTLNAARERGASVAIDDFGTGYSSLSYLKNLPVDTLKIDQSFIMGVKSKSDLNLIDSIIQLAHGQGMKVVAEGVETLEMVCRLRDLGCDYAQGYYFARPLPEVDVMGLLTTRLPPQQ